MDLILDLLATVSRWSRSNLSEIALALVGCLLVLFGADFKGWVEQRLGSIAGALRVPLMALLCVIGSGAALIYATPWVVKGLSQFNNYSLAPVLLVVLFLIGVVAACRSSYIRLRQETGKFMSKKLLDETSKFLSFVLRHEPQAIGLVLDSEGWANIDALISGAARDGRELDRELIEAIVTSSDKKRFSISEDGQLIRAVQGHSTKSVDLQFEQKQPPQTLYHGTATRFLDSIKEQGLIPGSRHHVHLSQDIGTASAVGKRYGTVVILQVAARQMEEQGFKFFHAENGVWLTEHVPVRFISTL